MGVDGFSTTGHTSVQGKKIWECGRYPWNKSQMEEEAIIPNRCHCQTCKSDLHVFDLCPLHTLQTEYKLIVLISSRKTQETGSLAKAYATRSFAFDKSATVVQYCCLPRTLFSPSLGHRLFEACELSSTNSVQILCVSKTCCEGSCFDWRPADAEVAFM